MDFILKKIENKLSLNDPGSFDYITCLRIRIEYSLFLCLGFLWKNFGELPLNKQTDLIAGLNNLSIGSTVEAIRILDSVHHEIINKKSVKILDSYPAIRNKKIGHGYEMAASIASALVPLYDDMVSNIPLLREECDIIIIQDYNASTCSFSGIRFPIQQNGQGVRWSCPKEMIYQHDMKFPRTYLSYNGGYYNVSPFIFLDPTSHTPFVFDSLVEKLVGKVKLNSVFIGLEDKNSKDYFFNELVCLTSSNGRRQISQSNGTIMNIFKPNYEKYIDVGFQKLIEDFLCKNRAYVCATIWGHGGVGKTACIQKICNDLYNNTSRLFSYIVFTTAKDRVYNPRIGAISPSSGNIRLYSEVINSIAKVLFDAEEIELEGDKLIEYERRISNFEDSFLIVIDDYETFEDNEKEKISNFLGTLNAQYHKAIITTRNRRFVIGQSISCNELDRLSTKAFISAVIKEQYIMHYSDIDRILKDEAMLNLVYKATSGRPIFIYQFIYLFMQKGYRSDLLDGIRTSKNAQEFLYGRIYQYLSKNAQYLFVAISSLTDDDLRFNLNILEYVLNKVVTEKDQFEESLEELSNQKVVEIINEVYGRVYSAEILQIMITQYQKYPHDFQSTVKNFLDSIGGKNINCSIYEAILEQADRSRAFGNEKETIEKYRRVLNDSKIPFNIHKTAIKHLADYLSNFRLSTPSAIVVMEEYLPRFKDDADIHMLYIYLLWSQGVEEKAKAVNSIQEFFSVSSHRKTDPNYLTLFALSTGYCIDFDIRYREYPKEIMRSKQYATTFNEYGKPLFYHVKSHTIKGKASLFHNIRVALVQTVKLCDAMGQDVRNTDKISFGLEVCEWMQQSGIKEPFLNQIVRLQNNLNKIYPKNSHQKDISSIAPNPQMDTRQIEASNVQDSIWSSGNQYSIGDILTVKVSKIMSFGVFVDLDSSTRGLIHISEIADRYINDIWEEFSEGQTCTATIIDIESLSQRISLSTKQFHK